MSVWRIVTERTAGGRVLCTEREFRGTRREAEREAAESLAGGGPAAVRVEASPPGRPIVGREKRKRYLVTLEPATAERARVIGVGNLSGGVATAVLSYRKRPRRDNVQQEKGR